MSCALAWLPRKKVVSAPPVLAARVNLNSAGVEVIVALLRGSALDEKVDPDSTLADDIARKIHESHHPADAALGPLVSLTELVIPADGLTADDVDKKNGTVTAAKKDLAFEASGKLGIAEDSAINNRREFVVRALSGGVTVRAWNFLLDLVVRSGRFTPPQEISASSTPARKADTGCIS